LFFARSLRAMIVTLTTDFGLLDPFVGIVKGVILGLAPQATIIDLTHGVPPGDILRGALALDAAVDYFPPGTIHLAVVDPGVGGPRKPLAVALDGGCLVGPDNGLFTAVLARRPLRQAVVLSNAKYHLQPTSKTFHGRDIFAPAAGQLARGLPLHELGDPVSELNTIDLPQPVETADDLEVHVLHVDHFGNLVTDLTFTRLGAWQRDGHERLSLIVGSARIYGLSATFSDVAPGRLVAYFGGSSRLEVAVRQGNAAATLNMGIGAVIHLLRP
jgi:S-adenosylmethionine hydrolase